MIAVTTTDNLPGQRIDLVLGPVIGSIACTTNKFDAGMKSLHTGGHVDRPAALHRDRADAITRMVDAAVQLGATAVVGMRFDHRQVSGAWTELCAYGTAVIAHGQGA